MIQKKLIDQIEGEATVYFELKDEKVEHASIAFPHFRGMEKILEGKNALDALVITPRVCGICGHAHLMACVRAIENAYENAGMQVKLTKKAKDLREITLILEIIQNHFKWLYLVIIPALNKLSKSEEEDFPLKGAFAASLATKILAIFAGQWPHSSYMHPGGVTSDPSHVERLQALSYMDELINFFEKECLGVDIEAFLGFESCNDMEFMQSDIGTLGKTLMQMNMHNQGHAHDRFIVFGEHSFTKVSKVLQTRLVNVDEKYISTKDAYCPDEKTYAKNALYKGEFYESGPLARAMSMNVPLIKNMHRRFKDSAYTRVMSRVIELAQLLQDCKGLIQNLSLDESSFTSLNDITQLNAKGIGIVEAPRGSLVHKIDIEKGIIVSYEIITPTQWNLGSSKKDKLSPSQMSMKGTPVSDSLFIFRTFDVCSVCTTH
ncbi:MAG: hydrogenase [Arcobacter sp.]|nr:MAG: hydrogenase [Arcobacter sp.]